MMSSLALAAMARHGPSSLAQFSVLHNRTNWLFPVPSCNYAKSAEELLGLEKPKRPATPYIKFSAELRPALKMKNPNASSSDLVKIASKHWEQLGQDTKNKLSKDYEARMEEYRKQKEKFLASLTEDQLKKIDSLKAEIAEKKEKRKVKAEFQELGRPKRPASSYFLFCQPEMAKRTKETSMKQFHQAMKVKWDALSPAEKKKYEAKAAEAMKEYRKQMTIWEEKMIAAGNIEYVRSSNSHFKNPKDKSKADK